MKLVIWTKDKAAKVYDSLASVLAAQPGLDISVHSNESSFPPCETSTVIFVLGEGPKAILQDGKVIPKGRTTSSLRNQVWGAPNGHKFMFSYSPGIHEIDYSKYVDLLCDFSQAIRLAQTGSLDAPIGDYQWVSNFKGLIERIEEKYAETGKPVDVAFDTETLGLNSYAHEAYIVMLQFTVDVGTARCVYFPNQAAEVAGLKILKDQLTWLLNSPKVSLRLANGKYDMAWMWTRAAIDCTNFKFDTTAVGSLLDENRSNALNVHAKVYTPLGGYDDEFNRTVDKSRMDLVPPKLLLQYGGGDTDACLQVSIAEKKELLADGKLSSFYINILHPALRAFEKVEQGGVLVDLQAFKELESDLHTDIAEHLKRAKEILGGRIVMKHRDTDKTGDLNLSKAALITDFMFSPMGLNLNPKMLTAGGKDGKGSKSPSTAMEHLLMFKDDPKAKEFVELMKSYGSATKTLSTYVTGFQKHLRPDGRFHPSYWLFAGDKDEGDGGTNTGRLSCKDPAFQTIPKHTKWAKKIRRCYIAPPGMLVCERDYSQGELKVIACLANETTMIGAYQQGMDLHAVTAGPFAGFNYEQMQELKKLDKEKFDGIRQLGKAGNFGLIYGMGVEGFQAYAEGNYGVAMSLADAGAFRNAFFDRYPLLIDYHREYKAFAHQHGHVRSPLGRIRHLPLINSPRGDIRSKAERQSINSPVQGALSDMMIWCIALAHQQGWFHEAPCFGSIHDASYDYLPEDNWEFHATRMKQQMENLPFEKVGWYPQLKFTADVKIGPNMADLKEQKLAA